MAAENVNDLACGLEGSHLEVPDELEYREDTLSQSSSNTQKSGKISSTKIAFCYNLHDAKQGDRELVETEYDAAAEALYRARIRVLRRMHGMNQVQWSQFTGIAYKSWSHYELGHPCSRESLFRLRQVITLFKFSADWLYWGDTDGLLVAVAAQLQALTQEELKRPKRLYVWKTPPAVPVRKRFKRKNGKRRPKAA
jgi:DNA-binding XRE family transcriptional regulator